MKAISIHAPRAGSDGRVYTLDTYMDQFQSTLPVRGATHTNKVVENSQPISIHAPRAGSDVKIRRGQFRLPHFNPRSPCGERLPLTFSGAPPPLYFNPRSPCGERQPEIGRALPALGISIHAPRAGSDAKTDYYLLYKSHFNPRSPCGERRLAFRRCRIWD